MVEKGWEGDVGGFNMLLLLFSVGSACLFGMRLFQLIHITTNFYRSCAVQIILLQDALTSPPSPPSSSPPAEVPSYADHDHAPAAYPQQCCSHHD